MFTGIINWLMSDSEYYENLNSKLHLGGKIIVPRGIIRNAEIFLPEYVYELELGVDGFIEITAHKKIDLEPISNVVKICY